MENIWIYGIAVGVICYLAAGIIYLRVTLIAEMLGEIFCRIVDSFFCEITGASKISRYQIIKERGILETMYIIFLWPVSLARLYLYLAR